MTNDDQAPSLKRNILIVIAILAFGGFTILQWADANFSAKGLARRAIRTVEESGCVAASELLDRAVQRGGGVDVVLARGACRSSEGKYDEAIIDYSNALEIDPNSSRAYYERGLVRVASGHPDEAIKDWESSARLNSADPNPLLRQAEVERSLGHYEMAIQAYSQAARRGADRVEIGMVQADLYREMSDLGGALKAYESLLQDGSGNLNQAGFILRAPILQAMGNGTAARELLNEALQKWPENAFAYYQLGFVELMDADFSGAQRDFRRAAELGEKFRMLNKLMEIGIETAGGSKADRRDYFAPGVGFLPTALLTPLYQFVACRKTSDSTCVTELANEQDAVQFALRPIGALVAPKLTQWPSPIIDYLRGRITAEQLRAEAGGDPSRRCDVALFSGFVEREPASPRENMTSASNSCVADRRGLIGKLSGTP